MRFNNITFHNYRCFLDGSIEFQKDNKKNMTILIAPNGGGKTETLFAFWWTLYDYDFSKLTNKEHTPYALNSELYRELEQSPEGSHQKCSVTLEFEDNGKVYQVKKSCLYRKTEKRINTYNYRELSFYKENGELSLPIREEELIEKMLCRIIPKNILYGIIFDGERMQKLNTPDESSVNAIRGVISDITNVELLENCSENFKSLKRKLNKNLKQQEKKVGNKSIENIINDEENKSKEQQKLIKKNALFKEELKEINVQLDIISNLLSKNREVQEIENQRIKKRESLAMYEKNLDSYYKNFSATLRDGYLLASEQLFLDVEGIIKKYDVPQDLTVPAVRNILKRNKCICGREMDDNAIKELTRLMNMLPPDNINSTLSEIVRQMKQRVIDIKEQAKNNFGLIQSCEASIKECIDTISSLSARINSMDSSNESIEEAKRLEKDNEKYTLRKGFLVNEIPNIENKIIELDSEIKKLREERENYKSGIDTSNKLNKEITYIEKCILAVENIKEINKKTALEAINEKLSKAYNLLSEDAERGRKIRIIQHDNDRRYQIAVYMEEDYNKLISIWKHDGMYKKLLSMGLSEEDIEEKAISNCIDSNSTGQSKINTFAFVKAILDYSNSTKDDDGVEIVKDYPLLIDAPFGDISAGNLRKSSNELHNFAKQVILMIDEDKFNSLREAFDPYTVNMYTFSKADGKNHSIITLKED